MPIIIRPQQFHLYILLFVFSFETTVLLLLRWMYAVVLMFGVRVFNSTLSQTSSEWRICLSPPVIIENSWGSSWGSIVNCRETNTIININCTTRAAENPKMAPGMFLALTRCQAAINVNLITRRTIPSKFQFRCHTGHVGSK